MLVPTHKESPAIGVRGDRTVVTSIRIPSATSTISASFMQYTVSVAGALKQKQSHSEGRGTHRRKEMEAPPGGEGVTASLNCRVSSA